MLTMLSSPLQLVRVLTLLLIESSSVILLPQHYCGKFSCTCFIDLFLTNNHIRIVWLIIDNQSACFCYAEHCVAFKVECQFFLEFSWFDGEWHISICVMMLGNHMGWQGLQRSVRGGITTLWYRFSPHSHCQRQRLLKSLWQSAEWRTAIKKGS